jgi:hypothetical protein
MGGEFMGPILEPLRLFGAIPSVKERGYLPKMEANDTRLEDDGRLLQLMMTGESSNRN